MSPSIALPALVALLVGFAGVTACERPRNVAVRVSIPGPDSVETPVTGVGLVALPYDRDSVLAALEASAATPRPDTSALDSLFRAFRVPFVTLHRVPCSGPSVCVIRSTGCAPASTPSRATRPSTGSSTPASRGSTTRWPPPSSAAERARQGLDRARAEFVDRSESLRASDPALGR